MGSGNAVTYSVSLGHVALILRPVLDHVHVPDRHPSAHTIQTASC